MMPAQTSVGGGVQLLRRAMRNTQKEHKPGSLV
jgi:hypothetical protein